MFGYFGTMTPETVLEGYRPLVEGSDQAIPILMIEFEDGEVLLATMEVCEEMSLADGIRMVLRSEKRSPVAVQVCGESWLRIVAKGGEEEPVQESVFMFRAERGGAAWMATARFVRTSEGVRWVDLAPAATYGDLSTFHGDVPRAVASVMP